MQRRTLLLLLAPSALVALPAAWAQPADSESPPGLKVTAEQMREALATRFPRRYPMPGLVELHLQTPSLQLLPQQNRVRAQMPVQASGPALGRSQAGSLEVDMGLRYEASDRTLRAHRLRLGRLRFPDLPSGVVDLLNQYAPALAEQALQEVVLHQLEPADLRAVDAMGMQPGEITVTDTGLVVGLVLKPL